MSWVTTGELGQFSSGSPKAVTVNFVLGVSALEVKWKSMSWVTTGELGQYSSGWDFVIAATNCSEIPAQIELPPGEPTFYSRRRIPSRCRRRA